MSIVMPCDARLLPAALVALLAALVSPASAADAATTARPRLYEMSTETGMPHLEENLRYAVRHERRCLDPQDLSTTFWMLGEVSLQDCRLVKAMQDAQGAAYLLQCSGGRGTSGGAKWQITPQQLSGRLDVRLGGKNMTFHQRVIARPVGDCP